MHGTSQIKVNQIQISHPVKNFIKIYGKIRRKTTDSNVTNYDEVHSPLFSTQLLQNSKETLNAKYENVAKYHPHRSVTVKSAPHHAHTRFHFRVQKATTDCRADLRMVNRASCPPVVPSNSI